MNDFKAEPAELRQQMVEAVNRVLESGWYVLGKEVEEFEAQWASICGVSSGVGVGNGMDAIEVALRALDIGPGDEVITTSMTAFATVLAILRSGASPVLADIDTSTGLMCMESVSRCLSSSTKAVLLVHLYGQVRSMDTWMEFCAHHGVSLLEDCAQAHLARAGDQVAGSFGEAGLYSFYPTKNLGAVGDAGMIVTNRDDLRLRASRLRNYGQSERYFHPEQGLNSRLDEIQAAILRERIKWLERFTSRRVEIAVRYRESIDNPAVQQLAPPYEKCSHVYHLYVILCSNRDALQNHLQGFGVQSICHYPVPIHHQEACVNLRLDPRGLSECERFSQQCLSIPCHPLMDNQQVEQVVEAVNTFKGA